jgi:putative ABC transport system ATP-binding protein
MHTEPQAPPPAAAAAADSQTGAGAGAAGRAPALIELHQVTRIYRRGGEALTVLDRLELEIERGGFYALMGPSGSGKSTLLNLIGGLDRADGGSVRVAGEDLGRLSSADLARWRADNVGFVFQGFNLLPVLSAQKNVELPLLLTRLSSSERRRRARHALALVGLEDRRSHRPSQLSGGQEQRVAIARALVSDPLLILADEPTGNLDRESAGQVLSLLRELNERAGKTILMVTHDPRAAEAARTVITLDKGQLGGIRHNR